MNFIPLFGASMLSLNSFRSLLSRFRSLDFDFWNSLKTELLEVSLSESVLRFSSSDDPVEKEKLLASTRVLVRGRQESSRDAYEGELGADWCPNIELTLSDPRLGSFPSIS